MHSKEKNLQKLENVPGTEKSYQGGYINMKVFLKLIVAV